MDQPFIRYTGNPLDRIEPARTDAAKVDRLRRRADARVTPVWGELSFSAGLMEGEAARALLADDALPWAFLGRQAEAPVFAVDVGDRYADEGAAEAALGARFNDLRRYVHHLDAGVGAILAQARGVLHWQRAHRFCGACGAPTAVRDGGHLMVCTHTDCAREWHPALAPAVIMLVTHTDPGTGAERCLLAHHDRLPDGLYSTLAGFVEIGESLEEAVRRETLEETGVRVGRVTYLASQPWPFPSQLMLGFFARAETDAITLADDELTDAQWFTRDEVVAFGEWGENEAEFGKRRKLPRKDSIARVLVETWLGRG